MPYFSLPFVLLLVGLWIAASFIVSKMGWSRFASKYESNIPFEGTRAGIISATVNSVNYRNAMILRYNQEGIYLRPTILVRLFHKPLFIPWKEIKSVRDKKMFMVTWKELIIGEPNVGVIGMSDSAYNKIHEYLSYFSK